jgi:isovaleryl-CoA dehydrogenase
VAHSGLVQLLLEHGTDRQRREFVPLLISGQIGATASTEPSGGSHVTAITTSAARADDGYLLSGRKAHITNAPVADLLMIVGRVPEVGARDITLFLVESHQSGVRLGAPENLLGQRTSPTGAITLDKVPVPSDRIVGAVGDGLATLYSFLAFDRLMYAVVTAAQLECIISRALGHATTRRAFGAALAEHELIQDKIVDMKVTMESSRWLAYSAADALARHDADSAVLASCAKIAASEGLVRASTEVIQILGHSGFEIGSGVERYLRDAIAFRIAGGTTEMQKKNIFKYLANAHAGAVASGAGQRR